MEDTTGIIEKIKGMLPFLNEAQRRLYLASEALYMGRGGKALLKKGLGVSHNTINAGIKELSDPAVYRTPYPRGARVSPSMDQQKPS